MGSTQRGAVIAQNDNGSLEKLDGSRSYIGTATLASGKVITKRFRGGYGEEKSTIQRWLDWQSKNGIEQKEKEMATTKSASKTTTACCPFSGNECGATCPLFVEANQECSLKIGALGVFTIARNYKQVDLSEPLELIALALGEIKPAMLEAPIEVSVEEKEPTEEDGIEAFFEGKTFLNFVNLHGKAIAGMYGKFCKENGFPSVKEKALLGEVESRFSELKRKGVKGGSVFEAA